MRDERLSTAKVTVQWMKWNGCSPDIVPKISNKYNFTKRSTFFLLWIMLVILVYSKVLAPEPTLYQEHMDDFAVYVLTGKLTSRTNSPKL